MSSDVDGIQLTKDTNHSDKLKHVARTETKMYKPKDLEIRRAPAAPTLSRREIKIDESLERLGWWMDDLILIPGLNWRIGLDALVGLIPGFGDTASSLVSFYILGSAVRYGVPKVTLLRMGMNLGIDYLVGSLPFVGDLFDAWWKSNQRNIELMQKRATVSAEEAREGRISDWLFVGLIIFLLIAIVIGAAAVSFYLLIQLANLFA